MIHCTHFDDLLFEGDPESMAMASRHADSCAACAQKLADWMEISETASTMQTTWQNDMLWPRIERAIKQEQRRSRMRIWQIAAALVLAIGLGALSWRALQNQSAERAFEASIIREAAMDEVEKAQRQHLAAIERLENLAEPRLDDAETPLMVSYKEKLMLLDDAISQCETVIGQNRQNAHLRKQLLTMYSEKEQTLQDVLREGTHASNQ